MAKYYTGNDIEDLAARGVRQLEVGPGVILTDVARQQAETLGITLVTPDTAPSPASMVSQSKPVSTGPLPNRPRGCQHTPVALQNRREAARGGGAVVEQLVEAVSALKRQGG